MEDDVICIPGYYDVIVVLIGWPELERRSLAVSRGDLACKSCKEISVYINHWSNLIVACFLTRRAREISTRAQGKKHRAKKVPFLPDLPLKINNKFCVANSVTHLKGKRL